jgi:hypothetical protein
MMTVQDYYRLMTALQGLETQLDQVRQAFNVIDPNQLPTGTPTGNAPPGGAIQPPAVSAPAPAPAPVQKKPRKKMNAPVIHGALGDVVEDILNEKAKQEAAAAAPKRIAPYEVRIKDVAPGHDGKFYATVTDPKYGEEGMVPVPKEIYEDFQSAPDQQMVIALSPETLEKTEWFPAQQEPTATAEQAETE